MLPWWQNTYLVSVLTQWQQSTATAIADWRIKHLKKEKQKDDIRDFAAQV